MKSTETRYERSNSARSYKSEINSTLVKTFDKERLKAVQLDLKNKKLYSGRIDGIYGPKTEKAIQQYNNHVTYGMSLPRVDVTSLSPQVERQIKANKELGNFDTNYMIVNDKTNTGFVVNPDHSIKYKFPVITGKHEGDYFKAPSSSEYLKANPTASFEDYIKYLDANKQKVTPSGLFTVSGKNPNPSSPKGVKGKVKQFLYDNGIVDDPSYDIKSKRYTNYGDALLNLSSIDDKGLAQAIHGTNNFNRLNKLRKGEGADMSGGCVNVDGIMRCYKDLSVGAPVEILSEDFNQIVDPSYLKYQKAPKKVKEIAKSLYTEKNRLTHSSDFEEDVARTIAVIENESTFGQSPSYKVEDFLQTLGILGADNSVGPGQVKWNTLAEGTKTQLQNLDIKGPEDLRDSKKAPLAVYEKIQELKLNGAESDFDIVQGYRGERAKDMERASNISYRYLENMKKRKATQYNTGGALQDILGVLNPLGQMGAIGSAVLPTLQQLISPREPVVLSASPGNYQSGGPVKPTKMPAGFPILPAQDPMMAVPVALELMSMGYPDYPASVKRTKSDGGGKSLSKPRFREKATGGPVDPPLQFLGRTLTVDPSTWSGPANDSGVFGIRDNHRFTPETIVRGENKVSATDKTPYMLVKDNIYYNPYDKVYNSRQDDGSYVPIETQRAYTTRRTYKKDMAPIDPKHEVDNMERTRWKRELVLNPHMEGYNVDSKMIKEHLKKYPSYASGGDVPLSSNSFQVTGDPSRVDSETYQMGPQMVKLDDNEVYKQGEQGGYVFSNRLKQGKTSYADLAKVHEKKIGKAEKKVSRNPLDEFSKNTIEHSNRVLATLAGKQELQAQAMGLREPLQDARLGEIPSKQSGGPLDWMNYTMGAPQQTPLSSIPTDELLDVYGKSRGYGLQDTARQNELLRRTASDPSIMYQLADMGLTQSQQVPVSSIPTQELQGVYNNEGEYGINDRVRGDELARRNGQRPQAGRRPSQTPFDTNKFYEQYPGAAPRQEKTPLVDPLRNPYMPLDQISNTREPKPPMARIGESVSSINPIGRNAEAMTSLNRVFPSLMNQNQPPATGDEYRTPYTFGDALQTVTAVSKFGQLIGGAEKQKPYTNNTPITQRTYDPSSALYQNQRQFTNTYNQLSNTPSLNMSRALASNLYAQNINQGNNILSKYDQMNQEARSSYQNQIGARRAENIRYNMATDDINARNRGAYTNAVDNAFNSLGNLGQNFNQKAYSDASIALLRDTYKDIFPRFQQMLQQQGLFK